MAHESMWHGIDGGDRVCVSSYLLGQQVDDVVDAKDELAGAAALFRHAVDAARNGQAVRIGYEAFVDDGRPERAERVHRFADQKLAAVALLLPVASRYVLGHGVAKHMVHGVRFANMSSLLANDDGQFDFPIQLLQIRAKNEYDMVIAYGHNVVSEWNAHEEAQIYVGNVMQDDVARRPGNRAGEFAEEHRLRRRLFVLLLAMAQIVEANANDFLRIGDRCQEPNVFAERFPFARSGQFFQIGCAARCNQPNHVTRRGLVELDETLGVSRQCAKPNACAQSALKAYESHGARQL